MELIPDSLKRTAEKENDHFNDFQIVCFGLYIDRLPFCIDPRARFAGTAT